MARMRILYVSGGKISIFKYLNVVIDKYEYLYIVCINAACIKYKKSTDYTNVFIW